MQRHFSRCTKTRPPDKACFIGLITELLPIAPCCKMYWRVPSVRARALQLYLNMQCAIVGTGLALNRILNERSRWAKTKLLHAVRMHAPLKWILSSCFARAANISALQNVFRPASCCQSQGVSCAVNDFMQWRSARAIHFSFGSTSETYWRRPSCLNRVTVPRMETDRL